MVDLCLSNTRTNSSTNTHNMHSIQNIYSDWIQFFWMVFSTLELFCFCFCRRDWFCFSLLILNCTIAISIAYMLDSCFSVWYWYRLLVELFYQMVYAILMKQNCEGVDVCLIFLILIQKFEKLFCFHFRLNKIEFECCCLRNCLQIKQFQYFESSD